MTTDLTINGDAPRTSEIPAHERARKIQASTSVIADYAQPFADSEKAAGGELVGKWLSGSPCPVCEGYNTVRGLFFYEGKGYLYNGYCITCGHSHVH
jgi:hypothetical protein